MFNGADISGSPLPRCTTQTSFNSIGKLLSFAQKKSEGDRENSLHSDTGNDC